MSKKRKYVVGAIIAVVVVLVGIHMARSGMLPSMPSVETIQRMHAGG